MNKTKIVIIDDDLQHLELLSEFLTNRYKVRTFGDSSHGLSAIQESPPDLVILDIDMPVMNGFELCETLRADPQTTKLPVLFLTAEADSESMQKALKLGATDYLVKPFRLKELLRRIELRLGHAFSEAPLKCGNLTIDRAQACVRIVFRNREEQIHLPLKQLDVLEVLAKNTGRLLAREAILNLAFAGQDVSDRAIDLNIFRLRKILSKWNHEIASIYGRGYSVLPRGAKKRNTF
ncbi:MAG: response regulator transcription factor [Bdellovibrionota bacterium]